MFRPELQKTLAAIFGVAKTTYDAPSDQFEQDVLFVDVTDCKSNAGQGKVTAKVTGTLTMFSQANRLPFGFFNKKISQAAFALTKSIFFFDIDVDVAASPARIQNISERRTSFVFLYSAQFDPDQGSLTSLQFDDE